ncbi:helix-turn-helix transcriptional regulator [Sulfitobacter sp. SK012]|nr:helix-turn-helix transcriptional regulator [Sulfitobacter sp. SK012]
MLISWNTQTAQIIDNLESDTLPEILSKALQSIVEFDFTVVFGYVGNARPLALYDDFSPDRRVMHVDDYQEGPYLLDPFYLAATGDVEAGPWRLKEIAPDRFYQGEYFRNYYARTGLAEEVGFLVDVHENLTIVVSLMRKTRKFSKSEMKTLKAVWPVINAACRRHWRDTAIEAPDQLSPADTNIERAFLKIGEGVLTPREREVVELTLRGHSADALGKLLGISSGTVRIHRRNIYAKLRISSQGELFSTFISAIADTPRTSVI